MHANTLWQIHYFAELLLAKEIFRRGCVCRILLPLTLNLNPVNYYTSLLEVQVASCYVAVGMTMCCCFNVCVVCSYISLLLCAFVQSQVHGTLSWFVA